MATFTRRFSKLASDSIKLYATTSGKRCMSTKTIVPSASISTVKNKKLQQPMQQQATLEPQVRLSKEIPNSLQIIFEDGSEGTAPYTWLRENCQCPECFDNKALGRKFILDALNVDTKPNHVETRNGVMNITWDDGHEGVYDLKWLKKRSFTNEARKEYRQLYKPDQVTWGKDVKMDTYDYSSLFCDDKMLLDYLMTVERKGIALVKDTPVIEDSGAKLIDHIAFVKMSHFGRRSPVRIRENANNLAWTNAKLGLHNDLAQYEYQAGLIFIHMIKQHIGKGGESLVSDGLHCAEILKQKYPKEFEILTNTEVYFWDKGTRNYYLEMEKFFKITRGPIIGLNASGEISRISVNNAVRDSHLDLPPNKVNDFYKAAKLFYDLLYENSYGFKMENGDMLTLDNVRCQHGREGYGSRSDRHIESAYLDWDEARCRRRRLQEQFNLI